MHNGQFSCSVSFPKIPTATTYELDLVGGVVEETVGLLHVDVLVHPTPMLLVRVVEQTMFVVGLATNKLVRGLYAASILAGWLADELVGCLLSFLSSLLSSCFRLSTSTNVWLSR